MPDYPNVISNPKDRLQCEIAVIGSGPGGAMSGSILSQAGHDVLMVEEGPYLRLNSCRPFSREEMVQKYRNGGLTVALGNPKVVYAEANCVGGGSEINSSLFYRTPPEILECWRDEFRVEGLSDADLEPHFQACETELSVGPIPGNAPPASLKLAEGAERLGWNCQEAPRSFRYESAGSSGNSPKGTRQSMTETLIPKSLELGCRLLPDTRVRALKRQNGKWLLNSKWSPAGSPVRSIEIEARHVFLCCGAVQTPAILRRSGIKQNIGNSLELHPFIKVVAQFPEDVNYAGMGVPVHQVREFVPQFSTGCSISGLPHLALGMSEYPDQLAQLQQNWRRMAVYYAMASVGRGTVRSVPGYADPLVRYRLSDADLAIVSEGLRKLCRLLFVAGATTLYPSIARSTPLSREADLDLIPKQLPRSQGQLMTVHLFCSCPMGEDNARCATDSFGRVRNVPGLSIADASLLCTSPGINPQGSIMAIARRNAMHFLAGR